MLSLTWDRMVGRSLRVCADGTGYRILVFLQASFVAGKSIKACCQVGDTASCKGCALLIKVVFSWPNHNRMAMNTRVEVAPNRTT